MNLAQSRKMHSRALEIIPSGTNTNSKRVEVFLTAEHFPSYIEKAKGAYVWDLDGNKYVDYIASLAPVNIGYSIDRINSKIRDQLEKGILFSLPSSNEVELSEMLIEKIPGAEMVRFLKTGAEVTSAAVRIARLVTGRDMVLSCGYHGWHDWWSAKINARGIP
ncbi:MAG TPA: aminotransferase class III-fold pyridoxal phosphate-dependent enzyme, partial [bacterium]|nr:aminotransferase class III-fold pyridoxal phosphate-dependent enzyme [bacterium]